MNNNYQIDFRFWITKDNEAFLGKGRIALLLKIQELGSLKKASEALKMSYRKAYYSINHLNKFAEQPVVIVKRGGKNGGSTQLTPYGINLIERFIKIQNEIEAFIAQKTL